MKGNNLMEKTKFPIPQEDYNFVWGHTNKKYGLLDTKEGEAY